MRKRHVLVGATVVLLAGLMISPFALFAGAIWLSDRTHRFGPYDPRYWLLVRGTSIDRLGVLAPEHGSISYAARGQDGNSPARVHVTYTTRMEPGQVIDAYHSRCQALRLQARSHAPDAARLECSAVDGDEIGIAAQRRGGITEVSLGGWVF